MKLDYIGEEYFEECYADNASLQNVKNQLMNKLGDEYEITGGFTIPKFVIHSKSYPSIEFEVTTRNGGIDVLPKRDGMPETLDKRSNISFMRAASVVPAYIDEIIKKYFKLESVIRCRKMKITEDIDDGFWSGLEKMGYEVDTTPMGNHFGIKYIYGRNGMPSFAFKISAWGGVDYATYGNNTLDIVLNRNGKRSQKYPKQVDSIQDVLAMEKIINKVLSEYGIIDDGMEIDVGNATEDDMYSDVDESVVHEMKRKPRRSIPRNRRRRR